MLKKQIRIVIGSTALICSLGYTSGTFAEDALETGWDMWKNSVGAKGLINAINETPDDKVLMKAITDKRALLTNKIEDYDKNLKTLSNALESMYKKVGNYEYTSALLSSGTEPPKQKTLKAIATMQKNVTSLNTKITANMATQQKISSDFAALETQKLQLVEEFNKIDKTGKLTTPDFSALKKIKVPKFLSIVKKIDIGHVTTAVDVGIDIYQMDEQIKEGSTQTLENLNVSLKVVESLIPSIPIVLKTPSDVGREMIRLQSALKKRNESSLDLLEQLSKQTSKLINHTLEGNFTVDTFILRELKKGKIKFSAATLENDVNTAYNKLRKDYLEQHLSKAIANLVNTRNFFIEERVDGFSLPATTAFYTSVIDNLEGKISILSDEYGAIEDKDKGIATVKDYAATNLVASSENEGKQLVADAAEVDTLQFKAINKLVDEVNTFSTSATKLQQYNPAEIVDDIKPITPVKPIPTPTIPAVKLTGTKGDAQVTLKWNKTANAVVQSICYSTTSQTVNSLSLLDCKVENGYTLLENQTSPAIVNKLTNGKKYYFAIITDDTNRNVTSSNIVSLIPKGEAFPKTGYTKIANDGSKLPDSANLGTNPKDWACTRDNKTKLIWEVKTTDGGLRDMNNRYTNYTEDYPKCGWDGCEKDGNTSKFGDSTNTDGFVKSVNTLGLCAMKDWRIPTAYELSTLVYCSDGKYNKLREESLDSNYFNICLNSFTVNQPAINTTYFPDTKDNHYYSYLFWSSMSHAKASNDAWSFDFKYGSTYTNHKDGSILVRLVRGGQ